MFSLPSLFRRHTRPGPSVAHRPIVGLDIGASAIKVAEIQRNGKAWQLLHCGIQPLPPDAVMDGQIKQAEIVTQAIKDLLTSTGITTKQTALSLGGSSIITKKIQMATMTELDLEDQIALEAEEYIPFDIEDVNLDFQILNQQKETMEVLLTACKKDLIHGHTEVVRQAGLEPRVCDLDLYCLINAYQALVQPHTRDGTSVALRPPSAPTPPQEGHPEMGAMALVNLGTTFLNVAIMTGNGLPGYIRDHSLGGRQIIQELKSLYDLSGEEAEQWLIMPEQRAGYHSDPIKMETETVFPFLEQVVQQIRQAISFQKAGNPDQPVTAVCLSGGCALLPKADLFIQDRLNLPVSIANPFANLTHRVLRGKQETAQTERLRAMAPRFMVAFGLALRGDRP